MSIVINTLTGNIKITTRQLDDNQESPNFNENLSESHH